MPNFGTCLTVIDLDGSKHVVTRSGLLYAYGDKSRGVPLTLLHDAARVPDFGRGLKRPVAIRRRLGQIGYASEARFDAAHGRRYMLCAYRNAQERRLVLAAADDLTDLRQHFLDCGGTLGELETLIAAEKSK